MVQPGTIGEILRPYSMESGGRDGHDEFSGCQAEVVRDPGGTDVLVWIRGMGEVWIPRVRLRMVRS